MTSVVPAYGHKTTTAARDWLLTPGFKFRETLDEDVKQDRHVRVPLGRALQIGLDDSLGHATEPSVIGQNRRSSRRAAEYKQNTSAKRSQAYEALSVLGFSRPSSLQLCRTQYARSKPLSGGRLPALSPAACAFIIRHQVLWPSSMSVWMSVPLDPRSCRAPGPQNDLQKVLESVCGTVYVQGAAAAGSLRRMRHVCVHPSDKDPELLRCMALPDECLFQGETGCRAVIGRLTTV